MDERLLNVVNVKGVVWKSKEDNCYYGYIPGFNLRLDKEERCTFYDECTTFGDTEKEVRKHLAEVAYLEVKSYVEDMKCSVEDFVKRNQEASLKGKEDKYNVVDLVVTL